MTLTQDHRWRALLWGALGGLFLLPVVGMVLTSEVRWTAFDFVAAAVLLGGLGFAIELAIRFGGTRRARVLLSLAAVAGVATVWADGAVGVF